ncbi:MAG: DUF2779 domain-containing protein [Bacteroidia bacterium]
MSEKHILSKTSFLKSVQCTKSFFLYKNHYNLKDPLPKEKQAVFNRGHQVGTLAQSLFPNGIDVSPTHVAKFNDSVQKTKELIAQGQKIIYEAAFVFDGVLVALDILVNENDKWYAYEVKSSLKISAAYVMDAALQNYVISNCIPLEDFYLVTMNSQYVLQDELDVQSLFKIKSVKADAEKNVEFIKYHIQQAKNILVKDTLPKVDIGEKCFAPYQCDFFGTCWKHVPANNIFEFSGISKKQAQIWFERGFKTLYYIPEEELSGNTKLMVEAYKNHAEIVDKPALQQFFKKVKFPVAFFDAEMFAPAVPMYKGTAPFEAMPFLFSWHSMASESAMPQHTYFYQEENKYAGKALLDYLIGEAEKVNTILVFDTAQELKVLSSVVKHFPEYKKLIDALKNKFVDFSDVFTKLWYYHPNTKGSMSLKKIYESVFGKSIFDELAIKSGLLASYKYDEYLKETDLFKKEELKNNLIEYCKTDTQAMYDLFVYLKMVI